MLSTVQCGSPARRPTPIRALAQSQRCAAGVRACAGGSPDCRFTGAAIGDFRTYVRTWHGRLGHQQQTAPVRHRSERRHALRRRQWTSVPHCVYHALHVQHRRRGRCTHTLTRPHPRTHTPARADTTTVAETHAYRRACRRSVGSCAGLFRPLKGFERMFLILLFCDARRH
jgi:hypothetical protein